MEFFDSHCHLQAQVFSSSLTDILNRSRSSGVMGWLVCGTEPKDWPDVMALTVHKGVVPALGVHPWYIPEGDQNWLQKLENHLQGNGNLAVGEIGLDRTAGPPLSAQEDVFVPQLDLAVKYNRPVSIHGRKTWDRVRYWLKRRTQGRVSAVLHSFNGTREDVSPLLDQGAYFSFSGALTRTHNLRLPETLKAVPLDRLLIETDSPDLPPLEKYLEDRTRPNEPSNMVITFKRMVDILGLDPEYLAERLLENSKRVFFS